MVKQEGLSRSQIEVMRRTSDKGWFRPCAIPAPFLGKRVFYSNFNLLFEAGYFKRRFVKATDITKEIYGSSLIGYYEYKKITKRKSKC